MRKDGNSSNLPHLILVHKKINAKICRDCGRLFQTLRAARPGPGPNGLLKATSADSRVARAGFAEPGGGRALHKGETPEESLQLGSAGWARRFRAVVRSPGEKRRPSRLGKVSVLGGKD